MYLSNLVIWCCPSPTRRIRLKFQSVKTITIYFYGKFKKTLWFVLDTLDFHPEKAVPNFMIP
ncbi:MAG: hypothetical protein BWY95_01661 [Bacteroidetes bacterium ADurb.BinA104]|nr:MAG: hypothetical protein BWY95_01661 [Bacteroidetes bacterium ADurb.BinA104]